MKATSNDGSEHTENEGRANSGFDISDSEMEVLPSKYFSKLSKLCNEKHSSMSRKSDILMNKSLLSAMVISCSIILTIK